MSIFAKQTVSKVRLLQALWIFTALFQILILLGLIDYRFIAGGRLESLEQARQHLILAITVLLGFILIIERFYQSIVTKGWTKGWLRAVIFLIGLFFILNTIGNLLAKTILETLLFTPITLISAFFCIQLASKSKKA
ncbi:hypothetical protein [Roseivirga sp.]|uniref:hypothetical protein n=1 Tax=Roseivirga sp. TaxID=1964215 RepID=UPI003B525679